MNSLVPYLYLTDLITFRFKVLKNVSILFEFLDNIVFMIFHDFHDGNVQNNFCFVALEYFRDRNGNPAVNMPSICKENVTELMMYLS